jgi:6-phosphogluconolactonase/glucosamine-6-phosphate isomerase/deaminase
MQLEVYPTDAEAADAAAGFVAERLRLVSPSRRAHVMLAGGRAGRALMVALAVRGDLPWARTTWYLADERWSTPDDPLRHARIARESLFVPRAVRGDAINLPSLDAADADACAAGYAALLTASLVVDGRFDVVALPIGPDGALGSLAAGAAALDDPRWVAVIPSTAAGEPARVTVTPALLAHARHVVVTATGPEVAAPVTAALRAGIGPAARVLPSGRVTWIVDHAAAGALLKEATPVADDLLPR